MLEKEYLQYVVESFDYLSKLEDRIDEEGYSIPAPNKFSLEVSKKLIIMFYERDIKCNIMPCIDGGVSFIIGNVWEETKCLILIECYNQDNAVVVAGSRTFTYQPDKEINFEYDNPDDNTLLKIVVDVCYFYLGL